MANEPTQVEATETPGVESTPDSTSTVEETTTQPVSEAHVEEGTAKTTTQPVEEHVVEEDYRVKYERLHGKTSKLESEATAATKQLEENRQWVLQDESRTRQYLKDNGQTELQVEQSLKQIRAAKPGIWEDKSVQPTANVPTLTVDDVREATRREMLLAESVKGLAQKVPELDPVNVRQLSGDEREKRMVLLDSVERLANLEARKVGLAIPTSDMLINAYNEIRNPSGLAEAREEGEIQGMAKANSASASDFTSPKNSQSSKSAVNLTEEELAVAKSYGLTPEAYAESKAELEY